MRYLAVTTFVLIASFGTPFFTIASEGTAPLPAQTGQNAGSNVTLINPLGAGTNLSVLLTKILDFVIRIGAIVVVFMLIYVGYLFVMAQGAEAKITAARNALLWTVVGALILLGAQAISLGIQATVQAISTGN
ncbi:MAG: hypothetical protein NTY93_02995 [Candidatus Kaiserbacteria bacterium]|nr:hypothetical protein [Candidatus Kaiserbacteria bacterium]